MTTREERNYPYGHELVVIGKQWREASAHSSFREGVEQQYRELVKTYRGTESPEFIRGMVSGMIGIVLAMQEFLSTTSQLEVLAGISVLDSFIADYDPFA